MSAPASTRTFQCTVEQTYATVPVINTFAVHDNAASARAASAVAAAAATAFIDNFSPLAVNELVYNKLVARQVVAPLSMAEETIAETGDLSGEGCPGQTAVVVSLSTGLQGRHHRGRFYLCGVPLSPGTEANPNHLDAGFQAAYQAGAEGFLADLDAAEFSLVVLSRFSGSTLVPYPDGTVRKVPTLRPVPHIQAVNSVLVNSRLDSQRRRLGN